MNVLFSEAFVKYLWRVLKRLYCIICIIIAYYLHVDRQTF